MIVYIAGPMTGIAEMNYPAFNLAATWLRARGVIVINPAENPDPPPGVHVWEYFMNISRTQVRQATHIALLDKWGNSKGAREEVALAISLGHDVRNWRDMLEDLDTGVLTFSL